MSEKEMNDACPDETDEEVIEEVELEVFPHEEGRELIVPFDEIEVEAAKEKSHKPIVFDPHQKPDMDAEFDEDQLDRACEWLVDVFGEFLVYQRDAPAEPRIMESVYVVTQEDIDSGASTLPKGTTLRHWISARDFAKLFLPIILSALIPYEKGKPAHFDKIDVMIHFDEEHGLGHGGFMSAWRLQGKM